MKYYSTADKTRLKSFREAVIEGLAPNRGLYFPTEIKTMAPSFFDNLKNKSLTEIGYEVMKPYTAEDIDDSALKNIIEETINFDIPLVDVNDGIFALELFHGPTMAFKDVGARFMSRCLSHFSDEKVKILVATSGDTGSAVANGFYKIDGVEVVILYPSNKISDIQEQQLTTLGANITALEVDGTFDDCQDLVKKAFLDSSLREKMNLSSANSINIARWLPQSIYYYWIKSQLPKDDKGLTIAVPSGNFGNLSAGILAQRSGLKVDRFIAATNANDIIPEYLKTGIYNPKPSVSTIANAMDVGDPSNHLRMLELFQHDFDMFSKELQGFSMRDDQIKNIIEKTYIDSSYILDPHGAIGYHSLTQMADENHHKVFLETAHPVKFRDVVEPIIHKKLEVPQRLYDCLLKEKNALKMANNYDDFKEYLIQTK